MTTKPDALKLPLYICNKRKSWCDLRESKTHDYIAHDVPLEHAEAIIRATNREPEYRAALGECVQALELCAFAIQRGDPMPVAATLVREQAAALLAGGGEG